MIIAALSVLVGIYVYFEIEKPLENRDEIAAEQRLIQPSMSLLDQIELRIPGQDPLLLRQNEETRLWMVEKPFSDLASQPKVAALLSSINKLQRKKLIFSSEEIDSEKLPAFKLKTPESLELILTFKGEERPVHTFFGRPNPQRDSVYALIEPGSEVFLTSNDLDSHRTDRPSDFRERRLTTVEAPRFSEIVIQNQQGRMKFVRENASWKMIEPRELPIDSAFAESQLSKIALIRANDFLDVPQASLRRPDVIARIGFQTGVQDARTNESDPRPFGTQIEFARTPKKERIAGDEDDQYDYFAQSEKTGPVSISRFHYENLTKSYKDFVKKTFDDFIPDDVLELKVKLSGRSWNIKREGKDFIEETKGALAFDKVNQALSSLRGLRAESFEGLEKSPSKIDLQVSVKLKSGETKTYSLRNEKNRSLFWLETPKDSLKYRLLGQDSLKPEIWDLDQWNDSTASGLDLSVQPQDDPQM